MAMVGVELGHNIVNALMAAGLLNPNSIGSDQYAQIVAGWEAIGTAIVTYIQTKAIVNSVVTVASVGGVTPGTGMSGPGTGTAQGTIS